MSTLAWNFSDTMEQRVEWWVKWYARPFGIVDRAEAVDDIMYAWQAYHDVCSDPAALWRMGRRMRGAQ